MKTHILMTFVIIFAIYGFFRAHDIFFGSAVTFDVKQASTSRMTMTGVAKHNRELFINGENVSISPTGDFLYDFSPLSGLNIVTIEGKDTFGNVQKKTHTFVYKNNEQFQKTAQR